MKKLFENVGGNQFKLLTESVDRETSLIRSGLKKVFSAGNKELSYKRIQNVGLGYIKSPSEAAKTALQEAREIAAECGYLDDPACGKFVKEVNWNDEESYKKSDGDEADMSQPDEKREIQIGKQILMIVDDAENYPSAIVKRMATALRPLANELIQMHGKEEKKPYSGPPMLKGGHGGF